MIKKDNRKPILLKPPGQALKKWYDAKVTGQETKPIPAHDSYEDTVTMGGKEISGTFRGEYDILQSSISRMSELDGTDKDLLKDTPGEVKLENGDSLRKTEDGFEVRTVRSPMFGTSLIPKRWEIAYKINGNGDQVKATSTRVSGLTGMRYPLTRQTYTVDYGKADVGNIRSGLTTFLPDSWTLLDHQRL